MLLDGTFQNKNLDSDLDVFLHFYLHYFKSLSASCLSSLIAFGVEGPAALRPLKTADNRGLGNFKNNQNKLQGQPVLHSELCL